MDDVQCEVVGPRRGWKEKESFDKKYFKPIMNVPRLTASKIAEKEYE